MLEDHNRSRIETIAIVVGYTTSSYLTYNNQERLHQSLKYRTLAEVYFAHTR